MNENSVRPIDTNALLAALDSTTIHYYRFFPKEKMLVLPESTAREWQCECIYTNVPEDESFYAYLAEDDKADFLRMIDAILSGEDVATSSFKLDGFNRWCRVTMTTVARDEDGSPIEAIAIIEDRSEDMARDELNRARNEALTFMTQIFQIATRASDSTVVVYDYETNTTTAPEETADEWGVPAQHRNGPEEIAESGIVMPESKNAYISVHRRMLEGAERASEKIKLRTPDGGVETFELTFMALKDSDGNNAGKAVGVYNNISGFEEQTLHQAAMSRALSQGINAAFFVDLDNETFVLEEVVSEYASEAIENFVSEQATSGRLEDITKLFCGEMICDEDRDRMYDELSAETMRRKLAKSPSYFVQYRMDGDFMDQEHFEMHVVSTDHLPGNNAFVSFRCIDEQKSRELQQQQALQDAYMAAQQASNAKSEFFSRMSHDIRTPMNAIVGMTALANTHIDDKKRVIDCLSKITLSSQHLLGLINDVLDMSKIESGMVDLNVEGFDLSKLVENLISMSRHLMEDYHHEFIVNVHGIEHEKVIGDPQRIQQAFTNLMSNAAKYTPSGGTIRLSITEKPVSKEHTGCYEFVFEDNGIGMSQEFVEQIFEPFTRADDDHVNKQQGTGLGMSIANTIVQMMNGDIKVESELGKGSKFTVTIYLELQDELEEESLDNLAGMRVLVVDDDQVTCESACTMLHEMGMECDWALSGQEAIKLVESSIADDNIYSAVIVDWKMPGMDGLSTTQAIRSLIGEELPIIIASAYDWSEIELPARNAGVNGFISKPLFRSRVLSKFRELGNDETHEESRHVHSAEALSQSDFSGRRVLLVEDNALNREIATEFLTMAGLEVDVAENGREGVDAMEACEDGHYDMVFMDIQMPVMNGYDAARAIRSSDREYLKSVPIVAMTADAFAEDVNASRQAGMNEHIAKPIDIERLTGILRDWLGS